MDDLITWLIIGGAILLAVIAFGLIMRVVRGIITRLAIAALLGGGAWASHIPAQNIADWLT